MQIPIDLLEPETLRNVVEHFITREGTDYGPTEVPLDDKIAQVVGQLRAGKAIIVFDSEIESCNIVLAP